jgi:hypothetical protein
MANLRVIYNNIADVATITANTTEPGFAVANVKNTKKTSSHRSTGNIAIYTLTWQTNQKVNAIALPATNLVDGSTIRVELYSTAGSTISIADSGTLTAAKDKSSDLFTTAYTSNSFPYYGATKTSVWFPIEYTVQKVVITVTSNSPVDCSRIVCGTYWESTRQASNGITIGVTDNSVLTTTRAGDTYVDRKPMTENMQFQLQYLNDADRKKLLQIMQLHGSNGLMYFCVFPDNSNPELTQSYSIYGRSQDNSLEYFMFSLYNRSLNINSW